MYCSVRYQRKTHRWRFGFPSLFRYAELKGLSAQSARLTVISRMYERGADEDQVGAILGIGERSAVRELLPRLKPTLAELLDELV